VPQTDFSRRFVIGAAPASLAVAGAFNAEAAVTPSLEDDIRTFVSFGEHRCGTIGELRSAEWIAGRLRALVYAAELSTFPVRTILDPGGAFVAGEVRTPAFPQWHTPAAGLNRPMEGELRPLATASAGCVAIMDHPFPTNAYWQPAQQQAAVAAHAAGAQALVIAMEDPTDAIYACNQEVAADLPLPVAIVRPSALKQALAGLQAGRPATLSLKGEATGATGHYIAAHKPGEGEAIVISTPLTGWFHCGAERGPGIALLLKLARDLAASKRPVWLLVTGGHELGHIGMKRALGGGLPPSDRTALWVHLGAGIGARALDGRYGVKSPRALTISPQFEPKIGGAFTPADWTHLPPRPTAPGEAGDVISAGYTRIVGLAGSFPGFHTVGDDGAAVDQAELAAIGHTLSAFVAQV
jgi:hypothetical protein